MSSTVDDRRAALFVIALFAVGIGVRTIAHHQGGAPGGLVLQPGSVGARSNPDSLAEQSQRLATPLRRGERIDVDRADRLELTRLPRIGPALARRIVADRENFGTFGSLEELERVSGIGPRVLEELAPHVQFSGAAQRRPERAGRRGRISLNEATEEELSRLPGIGPTRAAAIIEFRRRFGRFSSVDSLIRVSGIGPATVEKVRGLVRVQ